MKKTGCWAQSVKRWRHKHKNLSLGHQNPCKKPGMVVCTCSHSNVNMRADRLTTESL